MKRNRTNLIIALAFFTGLSVALYPAVSNAWNSRHQSRAVAGYSEEVAEMDTEEYEAMFAAAREYNKGLPELAFPFVEEAATDGYEELLGVGADGIMGYISIPSIDVELPVYHGNSESVLSVGAGHLTGSSLPTGGEGTHCVISAHRGLPSSKLFTDLDQVKEGDRFTVSVLDQKLTYEVDQILIVEPHEIDALQIDPAMDLCTLMTCTPYGINSHRMLVRGHRIIPAAGEAQEVAKDAVLVKKPVLVLPAAVLFLIFLMLFIGTLRAREYQWTIEEVRRLYGGEQG